MKKDSIGKRMKENYEGRFSFKLIRRIPVIIRLDGKAFHSLLRNAKKPYDQGFRSYMCSTAMHVCDNIQGAKCAYIQSDEISILITDFDKLTTDAWFDYNIQKLASVSSGIASSYLSLYLNKIVIFDSRVFNLPKEEVSNYFIWRQQDWVRNSVQMLAQSYYSDKQLHKKNQPAMHEMLHTKGVNWADLDDMWKNGTFIYKGETTPWIFNESVIFTKNREMIEKYLVEVEK